MKHRPRRRLTDYSVILTTEWGDRQATIVDVSEHGARVRMRVGTLEVDGTVVVTIGGREFKACVVWSKSAEAGLEFRDPLPTEIFAAVNRTLHRRTPEKKKRFLMS